MADVKRDYSFEALVEVCGLVLAEITDMERGRVNKALKELREVHPDDYLLADLIYERAKLYRAIYPDASLTPQALAGNWSALPEQHHTWQKAQVVATNVHAADDGCETCGGDKLILYSTRPAPEGNGDHTHVFEEFAPCPDCNSGVNAGFWRGDGSRFNPPDPAQVRRRIQWNE